MTALELKAINMIGKLSEDKISYIVNIMEDLSKGGTDDKASNKGEIELSDAMQAVLNLQKYRKKGTKVIDYKEELSEILEERYASLG